MAYTHAKVQGQWSVGGSKDRVKRNGQTEGQMDGGDCITSHANMISNNLLTRRMAEVTVT